MLAKETDEPFDDKEWIYEIKWDGYRAVAEVKDKKVTLYSRNGNSFLASYPEVVEHLAALGLNAVLDGEVVVLNEDGRSDFQKLQHYENNSAYPLCYYVFDLLYLEGKNVCSLPLTDRKELLRKIIPENDPVVRFSEHIAERGTDFFEVAREQKMEGIMAKKADSLYHPGTRTNEWLKIKHHHTEEVLIAGFTAPTGNRKNFGSLILGIQSGDELKYAGHVGTGFNDTSLRELYAMMQPLIRKTSPFDHKIPAGRPVTWVEPKMVAEIKFTEWTRDGSMRHPVFLRLRDDKPVKEITMKNIAAKEETTPKSGDKTLTIARHKVMLTHTDKLYFPDDGVTKGMVIDYYQQVSKYIMPYLKNRPQSLKRNPNGIADSGFFQKDAGHEAPEWVKSIELYSESVHKDIDYILCNDKATLAYLNNLGCIEINPWHSVVSSLDQPDYLILDIDPSEKNTFGQVIETAQVFKEILDKAGADCVCKTSGATGLHIYIPMGRKYDYEEVKNFAQLICTIAHEQIPEFTSLERNLAKRGKDKIYLDFLQNRKGQTICSAYSLRPKTGATVSTPLLWKEVKDKLTPADYNMHTVPKRLEKLGDLFKSVLGKGIDMRKVLQKIS